MEMNHDGTVPVKVGGYGYGVKLMYDVPQGKHTGVFEVRVCWHNVVYQAQVDFGIKYLRF
jgi:hypothetical protein